MTSEEAVESLLAAIVEAYRKDDLQTLVRLCAENRHAILDRFAGWTKVPEALREDEEETRIYIGSIIGIAKAMEDLGHDGPIRLLTGGDDNPLERWNREFASANNCAQAGEYQKSNRIVQACLEEMKGAQGSAVDNFRPKLFGLMGSNYLYLGDHYQAWYYTRMALADCKRIGDRDGIRAYSENLEVLEAAQAMESRDDGGAGILEIRSAIARAQDLSDRRLYGASSALLDETLTKLEGRAEAAVPRYRAKTLGLLGSNAFKTGDPDGAQRNTQAALDICVETEDFDGIRIYETNLRAICAAAGGGPSAEGDVRDRPSASLETRKDTDPS